LKATADQRRMVERQSTEFAPSKSKRLTAHRTLAK